MSNSLLNIVIIAKMNTSLNFLATLEAILNQDYQPIKIVVVDANEENSLYSIGLQEDLSSYLEVEYIKLDPSFSMAKIRNHILDYLDGEYVAFLTANDSWMKETALSHIKLLTKHPEAAASCMGGILIDERKRNHYMKPLIKKEDKPLSKLDLYKMIKRSAQVVYKIKALKLIGGFDEELDNLCDGDMVIRLSYKYKVIIYAKSLCECRITEAFLDYELRLYLDYKKFYMKHMNLFIVNKKVQEEFYHKMIYLTRKNYMWLDYLLYLAINFVKHPIKTTGHACNYITKLLKNIISSLRMKFSVINETVKIKLNKLKSNNNLSNQMYVYSQNIRNIVIPEYIRTIKKGMFYGCDQLVSIEIPSTVTTIEAHAFHNCTNLRSVIFKDNSRLSKIGDYAFAGCSSLEELNLPLVSSIGAYTFARCYSLKKITFASSSVFPSDLEKIPPYAFAACKSLLSVEFGANSMLETIDKGAFFGCSSLQRVIISGRVKSLGAYAFAYCGKLNSLAFIQIDALESIGKAAFMFCENLAYFQLPSGLERIPARTFYGCSKLKYMKIPKKVLSINHQAFRKCDFLSNVLVLSADVIISQTAFDKHTQINIQGN